MSLEEMLRTELPLNRKERFFTGTVFPMITCKDNFKHLHILFSLLGITPIPPLVSNPVETNILFFSEYSLVESLLGVDKQRFKNLPPSKDTPDIIILIKAETKILIALEAKMYGSPNVSNLNQQMNAQQKILESIRVTLDVDKIYHFALLSEKYLENPAYQPSFPVVTWENIYKAYEPVCKNDYFFNLLRVSLEMFDDLVSTGSSSYGLNSEKKISGQQIYERYKKGTMDKVSMGRFGGINGVKLQGDINSGKWKTFLYETSSINSDDINRNWFRIADFVNIIEGN